MLRITKFILFLLIFINFLYCLSGVVNYPISSMDVYSIWLYKAKGFYFSQGNILNFLVNATYSHPQYPILLPYLFYLVFKFMGNYNEIYVLIFYPALYLLTIYLCFLTLRKLKVGEISAIFFSYIYSMLSPLLAMGGRMHAGEADIFIVLAAWLIVLLSLNFSKKRDNLTLFEMILIVAAASNIKAEGLFLAAIFIFLPIKVKTKLFSIVISVSPLIIWELLRLRIGIKSDLGYYFPGIFELFNRVVSVILLTFKEMLNYRNWYIFWPICALSLVATYKKFRQLSSQMTRVLFSVSLLFIGNYVFSIISPASYVSSSIDRVLMQLSPFYFPIFVKQTKLITDKMVWLWKT